MFNTGEGRGSVRLNYCPFFVCLNEMLIYHAGYRELTSSVCGNNVAMITMKAGCFSFRMVIILISYYASKFYRNLKESSKIKNARSYHIHCRRIVGQISTGHLTTISV